MSCVHSTRTCKTCPWRVQSDSRFDPSLLETTVVANLLRGHAHYCHSSGEKLCVGSLRHAQDTQTFNQNTRIGIRLGVIQLGRINDEEPIFANAGEMLEGHAEALGLEGGQ